MPENTQINLEQIANQVDNVSSSVKIFSETTNTEINKLKSEYNRSQEEYYKHIKSLIEAQNKLTEDLIETKKFLARPEIRRKNYELEEEYNKEFIKAIGDPSYKINDDLLYKAARNFVIKTCGMGRGEDFINRATSEMVREKGYLVPPEICTTKSANLLNTQINEDGGYLVRPDYSNSFITRAFNQSDIRSIVNVSNIIGNSTIITIDDSRFQNAGWVAELDKRNQTDIGKIGELRINAERAYAMPFITSDFLNDTIINVEQWLAEKINESFEEVESQGFLTGLGDSQKQPNGILTYKPWDVSSTFDSNGLLVQEGQYKTGAIENILTENSGVITADDFKNISASLRSKYRSNAIWIMNRFTWNYVLHLKLGNGETEMARDLLMNGVSTPTILGYPVVIFDDMPNIAPGNIPVVFGDFRKGYTIVQRNGTRMINDQVTDKRGEYRYVERKIGGAITSYDSLKMLKVSS